MNAINVVSRGIVPVSVCGEKKMCSLLQFVLQVHL